MDCKHEAEKKECRKGCRKNEKMPHNGWTNERMDEQNEKEKHRRRKKENRKRKRKRRKESRTQRKKELNVHLRNIFFKVMISNLSSLRLMDLHFFLCETIRHNQDDSEWIEAQGLLPDTHKI